MLRPFHLLLLATLLVNIAIWAQSVGAAWLLVAWGATPVVVAMAQTAITLPAVLCSLPGGVLADLLNRRRLLLGIYFWLLVSAALLVALVIHGKAAPVVLLALVLLTGVGGALGLPVLQASLADSVPTAKLAPAIALSSIGYNGARAIGPAVAGAVIGFGSVEPVFVINVVLVLAGLALLFFYTPIYPRRPVTEPARGAITRGVRYVIGAREIHAHLLRAVVFTLCASALWALLPLVPAANTAGRYGYLLASMGVGAVLGGLVVTRLGRWHLALPKRLLLLALLFSIVMMVVAWSTDGVVVYPALVLAGFAWINFTSPLNAAFQSSLPGWVRARAIAVLLIAFQGAMALGSLFWGLLAEVLGVSLALMVAAGCAASGMLLTHCFVEGKRPA